MPVRVALAPDPVPAYAREAVDEAHADVVPLAEAEVLVWTSPSGPDALAETMAAAPKLRWVHLRWAGVEDFAARNLFTPDVTWTCGKGVFAEPVAEHALALGLAGLRQLPERALARRWGEPSGVSLYDGRVTVLGGGGITERFVELVAPMRVHVTVVRRSGAPMPGVANVLTPDRIDDALPNADLVVVALALTPETIGIVDERRLRLMHKDAWLVNVGRGKHVVTDDLVTVLRERAIGGAALDVTEPEPLPDSHPLWQCDNCLITPHTANTFEMAVPAMKQRIVDNLRRYEAGEPLIGLVDPHLGY